MGIVGFISIYSWIIFIGANFIDVLVIRKRAKPHIEKDPSLKQGYDAFERGLMLWGSVPWLLMAYNIHFCGVYSIWAFLRPFDGNSYVLGWYASLLVLWFLGAYWIFIKDGAGMIVKHPGLFYRNVENIRTVKLLWLLLLLLAGLFVVFLTKLNMPVPAFR